MISINATLIVQVINLLVLVFILNRLLYRPVRRIIEKRQLQIDEALRFVKNTKTTIEKAEREYHQDRNEARSQIREKLIGQRQKIAMRVKEVLSQAQEQAKDQQANMLHDVEQQEEEVRIGIKVESELVAHNLAQVVLGREVT